MAIHKKTITALISALLLLLGAAPIASAEEPAFVIVVNKSNPVSSISREALSRLFLKKASKWKGDLRATPADQGRKASIRESFSREVHNRSVSAVYSYWQNVIFSGRGVPPVELASDRDVIAFVADQTGGVGYVSKGAVTSAVKILELR